MSRPFLQPNKKAKRNNFTLSLDAQKIIDKLPNSKKSKFVSQAIILYEEISTHH